jgi:hypothetical protein
MPENVTGAIAQIAQISASLQYLSHVEDPLIKLVFSPGTNRTLMELSALKGRLEYVQAMRAPINAATNGAPKDTVDKRGEPVAKK